MKINTADYEVLRQGMTQSIARTNRTLPELIKHYTDNNIGKDHFKRLCYDLFNTGSVTYQDKFYPLYKYVCEFIYKYADDSHVYTALKSIVNQLTKSEVSYYEDLQC